MVPQTVFQFKKDPSDSLTIYPVLPRDVFFWIWGKSGLVKALFKQNASFMALLYRRKTSEPGVPACGSRFPAGYPPMGDSRGICAVTQQMCIRAFHRITGQAEQQ